MNAIDVMTRFQKAELEMLRSETEVLKLMISEKGFRSFFESQLNNSNCHKTTFLLCKRYFELIVKTECPYSFDKIALSKVSKIIPAQSQSIEFMEREFLVSWFKHKGFDTWTSFKALVLHYYSQISEYDVLDFWKVMLLILMF